MNGVHFRQFSPSMLSKKNLPTFTTPCERCHTVATHLKKSGRCQLVYYCNRACQAADWQSHKARCQFTAGDPDLEARRKMRSTFKKLMASQYNSCLAIAAGRQGVFVLALTREKTDAIVFQFRTHAELKAKKGHGWTDAINAISVHDSSRCVTGALEDPDGHLVGTVTVEKWDPSNACDEPWNLHFPQQSI